MPSGKDGITAAALRKQRRQREYQEQYQCIKWLDRTHPTHAPWCFAVINEFHGMGGRINRSKQGVRKGVADLWHMVRTAYSPLLVVEFKASKPHDAELPSEQQAWLKYIRNIGGVSVCCRGFIEYKAIINRYFNDAIAPDNKKWQKKELYIPNFLALEGAE